MSRKKERWIGHYGSSQQILLVGEGDFSFSACLAKAFGSAENMVATSLDSEDKLLTKHWSCVPHLEELKKRGCLVLHEVDVNVMNQHHSLKDMKFDVIVFNFPHAGHVSWLCERDTLLIERHKNLLRGFFGSAREMLNEGGEIHVSHRDDHPYRKWELEKLAQNAGLLLKEKVSFRKEQYPGYHNKRGSVIQGNKKFPLGYPFTFKFSLDHRRNQETETTLSYTTTTTTISDHEDYVLMPELSADKTTILMISTGSSSTVMDHDDNQSDDIVDGNHDAFDEMITNDPYEMPAVGANNNHDDRDSYETTLIGTGRTSTVTEYDDDEDNIHAVGDNDERDDHIIDDKAENKIITDDIDDVCAIVRDFSINL